MAVSSIMNLLCGGWKAFDRYKATPLALALGLKAGGYAPWHGVRIIASVVSWVVLALCIVCGLLVIIEIQGLFESAEFQVAAPSVSHE